jgi:DNA-binding beta-propeller fold protein YncE
MTEVQRLPAGRHPRGMAVTAEGVLYVAPFEEHHIRQYDPPGYEEVHRFPTCRFPRHLVLAPDDSRLYYSCSSNRQLRWLDLATGRVEGIVPVGENPRSIDISVDGRFVATADFDSSSVCLVDTVALTHRRYDVPGADRIVGVAIRKSSPLRVYATSWNNSRLYALDPAEPVTISVPVRREEPRISRVPAPAPAPAPAPEPVLPAPAPAPAPEPVLPAPAPAPAPESAPAPAPAPAASDLPSIWSRIAEFLGSAGR